jgi:hypothetical protein
MRIILLFSLIVFASCSHTFKRHPLKGTNYARRYVSCESERIHTGQVTSLLRYTHEAEELRTDTATDGSYNVSYHVMYPGTKNSTTAYHAGLARYGALVNGKQWLENEWYRSHIEKNEAAQLLATGKFTQRKVLREYSSVDDYVEIESTEMVDGKPVPGELWERQREKLSLNEFRDVFKLRNPSEVEKDLLNWTITCFETWEHLQ